jgi:uncharacterized membrane protein YhaH (DUF805 family)
MREWVAAPLRRYADFNGRSSRAEYWYWALAYVLILLAFAAVMGLSYLATRSPVVLVLVGLLLVVFVLGTLIPTIAVAVRRLHDTNRSGWWYVGSFVPNFLSPVLEKSFPILDVLISLILFIYTIVLLVWYCLPGTPGTNDYGPNPYESQDLEALARDFQ